MTNLRFAPLEILLKSKGSAGRTDILGRLIRVLEASSDVSYVIDRERRLIYCNPEWDRFAESNGASQLCGGTLIGTDMFGFIPDVLCDFYSKALNDVSESRDVWERPYECSSPEVFRKFRMKIYPLKERGWFLFTNSRLVEKKHKKAPQFDTAAYVKNGIIVMCAHCRCSMRLDGSSNWDFVVEHVRLKGMASLGISHKLCPTCEVYFYS
jgi:hypothetical protein